MAFVGCQYEPVRLNANEVCFDEENDIPNIREKLRKRQNVTEWRRCEKYGVMEQVIEHVIEFQRLI